MEREGGVRLESETWLRSVRAYVAAAAAANEIVWWRRLLADFGSAAPKPTQIYCSSEDAIAMAATNTPFTASKHIGLRLHVLRRYQAMKVIDIVEP